MTRLATCLVLLLAPTAGAQEKTWWSLVPLTKPAVPEAAWDKHRTWSINPIDRFVLAKLKEQGFEPAPVADRRTLIRRVTFNLTGLPPTPEEVHAFLKDDAANAYEKVVDRLLASPRHGERWARHWMDVVHFAETHGHDQDVPREHAWPYRDYLIRSFNADKPYARFVQEQIAGDILYPTDPWATIALGFLAAGPWDESSLKDIREDTIDRTMGHYLDRDDMVTTLGLSFLSTTVQCARCHDHKFDPISIDEYYGLQAVFAGVDRANRVIDSDPKIAAERERLLKLKASLAKPDAVRELLKEPGVVKQIVAWESERRKKESWTGLDPTRHASDAGTPSSKLADLSVLFGGKAAAKDVYRFEAESPLERVTALRLEVLTDDSLPHKGPGRQDNGNLHLSEIDLEVEGKPGDKRRLKIVRAVADFDQDGWGVARAIDGNMTTAWGIFPRVGEPHQAVFVLAEPIRVAKNARLVVTLHQQHGGHHLVGRVRLSVTDAPAPSLSPVPGDIDRVLAKDAAARSESEQIDLARFVLTLTADESAALLPAPRLVYAAATEFKADGTFRPAKGCRPVHILKRGDIRRPQEKASPGALACVSTLEASFKLTRPEDEAERRIALARWVSDTKNPLTWRSIANRVWHYHFGRGLVATPSDFGRMGAKPSHPELLDWLASYLLENDGSLKKLHRLIVTSATYQQSSRFDPPFAKRDADNVYLWRMHRTRLDAESIRDAVLSVSGKIDFTMGGPSVKHFKESPGIHRTPKVEYDKFDPDSSGAYRRSVYRFIFRTVPDPFLDPLDCPDASQFTPARSSSITPQHALALLNDPFMTRMSEHLAHRVSSHRFTADQVRQAFELALSRPPTERELDILTRHANAHGLANACRVILNLNEFVFVN